jgi:hypothetical protein
MKARWGEGGGRILLGDNTGGGAVVPRTIRFQCLGIWRSTGFPLYTHIYILSYISYIHSTATCANFGLRRTFRKISLARVRVYVEKTGNRQNPLMQKHVPIQYRVTVSAKCVKWLNRLQYFIDSKLILLCAYRLRALDTLDHFLSFPVAPQPKSGLGRLLLEVFRSHSDTHHTR